MDHPSIIKLLEDDEDESMHSGADVEALSAALNRDIGGNASAFSQAAESESVGVLPHASSSASQGILEHWQTSSQDTQPVEDTQPKEGQQQLGSQSDQPSSQVESSEDASGAKDQDKQSSIQPKVDQPQLQHEHANADQKLKIESNDLQSVEKDQVQTSDKTSFQLPKQEASTQQSESLQQNTQKQNTQQQLNVEQQTPAANETDNAARRMRGSPSIPFQLLIPLIRPHLDKDREMQLQSIFAKLRSNEVSKDDFLRVIRNIVGDQMLRQAVNKVHMQLQAQAARNQTTGQNQYSIQNQASQRPLLSQGAQQFSGPHALSSGNSTSSAQNPKGHGSPPRQSVPVSTIQMQMDAAFPPVESSSQKPREVENNSNGRGTHAFQMHPAIKSVINPEREASTNSLQGINKQQQHLRPQTSFPVYGSSTFHSHPYARPPITAGTTLRPLPQNSQTSQSPHTSTVTSTQVGSIQPGNRTNITKYEPQNIGNDAKKHSGGSLTSHSTSQQHSIPWQTLANKEERSASLQSVPSVKQELADSVSEPPNTQAAIIGGGSFASGNIGQGNPAIQNLCNEGTEKQSTKMGFPTSLNAIANQATFADSTMQISSTVGTTTKTPQKKPSVGQKKPLEAANNSSAPASKKQKTSSSPAFNDQSIEHLNDVTAVSGVNLREEEEQLLSAPKEDSRASEATRRAVQEEEERLILQKGPLQKKLADIMFKLGLKKISNDVERCLSLCVEERLQGSIRSLIRLSKQRVDIEKTRHRFVITSDVHGHILEVNRKAKEEWDKKQAEESEKLRKVNETEGNAGSDGDKDKDEGRSKNNKVHVNKEEDDKMRATAANVAARAAVGGDDMLSKWQLMAEQARQRREGLDVPSSSSQPGKTTKSPGMKRNTRDQHEAQRRGSSSSSIYGSNRKLGKSAMALSHSKVARNISTKDLIAVLEREPQMSKSTLIYRLYEKMSDDSTVE